MARIYTLTDVTTGIIIYVGSTNMQLNERMWCHKYKFYNGKRTIIEQIDECEENNRGWLEGFWIWQLRVWGFPLVNKNTHASQSNIYKYVRKKKKKRKASYVYPIRAYKDTLVKSSCLRKFRTWCKNAKTIEDKATFLGVPEEIVGNFLRNKPMPENYAKAIQERMSEVNKHIKKKEMIDILENKR